MRPARCILLLALAGLAAARHQHAPRAAGSSALAAGRAVQLDACAASGRSAPSMTLDVSAGVCRVSGRLLPSPAAALQLAFPCKPNADTKPTLTGPALNLWAALAPVANTSAAAAAPGGGAGGGCSLTTLHPALYFHRVPPMLFYGYQVSGLPCQRLEASKALRVGERFTAGEGRAAVQYGLWLVPQLPSPSSSREKGMSTAPQLCRLSVTAAGRAFLSASSYPCRLVLDPEASLGPGTCYGNPSLV